MKTKVRAVLTAVACVSALFSVSAAGARGSSAGLNAPAAKPASAVQSSAADLKADRQILAMLSNPARRSISSSLNDDPDPDTCLGVGEACSTDNDAACCSSYCAPDEAGGGQCAGR